MVMDPPPDRVYLIYFSVRRWLFRILAVLIATVVPMRGLEMIGSIGLHYMPDVSNLAPPELHEKLQTVHGE